MITSPEFIRNPLSALTLVRQRYAIAGEKPASSHRTVQLWAKYNPDEAGSLDFGHFVSVEVEPISLQRENALHLTQFSDYAIRLLILLAMERGHSITIGNAAASLHISKNHLIKVANLLVRKGIVTGTRGRAGGIQLKKPAETISLGDVIRITEPGLAPVPCMSTPGSCSLEKFCGCPPYFHKAMEAFLRELDKATLANVAQCRSTV